MRWLRGDIGVWTSVVLYNPSPDNRHMYLVWLASYEPAFASRLRVGGPDESVCGCFTSVCVCVSQGAACVPFNNKESVPVKHALPMKFVFSVEWWFGPFDQIRVLV